ncbi:DEAD/DEAH box helicase family protein [Flavobacterium jejuense]|uniref:DEAD/DEAH box helicase family protein n=1 Tax=Flavobacterium jejuense TaxID=1544455 RepID=A0ABX0ITH0_9FLAO|nr:DEAD/DEAH box helicase [Flavobacterium jejuense]NHN26425.1 DEAD/DEAH box helicase family protein [Flavobacterium jejuense]
MPVSKDANQALVFDLSYDNILDTYLPNAFIVEQSDSTLYYITKIANSKTIEEFQIELDSNEQQLLTICEKLNTKSILTKYKIKNKVAKSLELLLSDSKIKKVVTHFIDFSLESFFKIISKTSIPLSVDLNKKDVFHKQQVSFSNIELEPRLHFSKTAENIIYRLSLFNEEKELFPFEHNFKILLDKPSWIYFDATIYSINHINANKTKPFLSKKEVIIPNKNSIEYFNKFIKNVVRKVPIEAEGFSVVTDSNCKGCLIKPTLSILKEVYLLEVHFIYEAYTFSITDIKTKHISLNHNDLDEFTVLQTIRDSKVEKNIIKTLESIGFEFLNNKLATFNSNLSEIDEYFNITELINLQEKIKELSITIDLQLNDKTINTLNSTISSNFIEKKDWFDVEMIIEIGTFKFPFSTIIPHLKSGNRVYELPDGSLFLIPIEWFSRYKSLAAFGKTQNNTIQIQKNQFTLLEETGIATENSSFNKEIIPYKTTGNIKATLRNYQEEGVNWLVKNYQLGLGSCLADDMGLGKTIQSLAYLDFVYTHFENNFIITEESTDSLDLFSSNQPTTTKRLKALVVAPSSLTYNWFNETKRFAPHFTRLNYTGIDRKIKRKKLEKVDLVFTSYSSLLKDINLLKILHFNFLIIDESQQIKNRNSKIYKAINTINAEHKVSLSGTPIENSLSDLWSQMQFINPNLLSTYSFFESHFKKPIEKLFDTQKVKELKSLINPYLLRRTKSEVAKDLPEISEQIFYSEMAEEQAKLYENEKSIIRNYLIDKQINRIEQNSKISILNALSKLRQLANHPVMIGEEIPSGKFTDVSAYVETLLQAKQKILVFSSYTSHLKIYTDWCDANNTPYSLLTGNTNVKDRESQVNNFQKDDSKLLFFISLKAGGVGLNLTKASYVILLDPWWNPFAELQAIGRAHRIGQENQVNVIRFIAKDTIEEKINQLQQTKKDISDSIIENSIPEEVLNRIDYILE